MKTTESKSYIGQSVPRANARRLLQGRGTYVDDLRLPRLAHVVFFFALWRAQATSRVGH